MKPKGHCVAVRVTSEDPDDGFKPTGGKVQVLWASDFPVSFYFNFTKIFIALCEEIGNARVSLSKH